MNNTSKLSIDGPNQVLYQWDRGQRLILDGYPQDIRVDFAWCGQDKSISSCPYKEDGVVFCDIPDVFLKEPHHIQGYVYVSDGDRGETVRSFLLPVIPRQKPGDYVVPEDIPVWHKIQERVTAIEELLAQGGATDGKTPVKGVDYWTEADQESIVQQVITALGTPVFGTVDADNNIILTGNLADGTYTLKYEDADGEQIEIGTVEIGGIAYTNLLPLAIGCDGSIQKDRNGNAVGYADGAYLTGNGSNPWQNASYVNDSTTHFVTGFIPYTKAQAEAGVPIYVKGVTMDTAASHTRAAGYNSYSDYTAYHDPVKFSTGKITVEELGTAYYKLTPTADFVSAMASSNAGSNFAYIRFSFPGSGSGIIITVGEPIE